MTVEGNQHTAALQGNGCIDDLVVAYLVDLTVPRADELHAVTGAPTPIGALVQPVTSRETFP